MSEGEKISVVKKALGVGSKVLRLWTAGAVIFTTTLGEGCKPPPSPVNNPDKPTTSAGPSESVTNPSVSVQRIPEPAVTAAAAEIPDQKPALNKEPRHIEPYQATSEDKKVFLSTLEKYINLDTEPQIKNQLNNPLFDEQFRVVPADKPQHSLPAHTAYTFENIQLSVIKDAQGKVSEENLLVGKIAKESLKIQPPRWKPIKPVNLNGKTVSLGDIAEFSPSEGNHLRYQQFNNGQVTIAYRTTPFLR